MWQGMEGREEAPTAVGELGRQAGQGRQAGVGGVAKLNKNWPLVCRSMVEPHQRTCTR
jgi:hypothetical protein